MKFRQYIPVSAGGSSPDPETYCPANGYIPEPGQPYSPPLDIGNPGIEEIYLLCQNSGFGLVSVTVQTNSVQWFFEVYDAINNLVYTSSNFNSSNIATYNFSGAENALYIIKIKLAASGNFTRFWVYQGSYAGDYPILQAKFNTPNLTDLSNAFKGVTSLRDVQFISSMDYLTTFYNAFYLSGLRYFKPSKTFVSLTDMRYMFYGSDLEIADFSDSSLDSVTTIQNICQNTTTLYNFVFPASMPALLTCSYSFYGSGIRYITLFTSAPSVTTYSSFLQNCYYLTGNIDIPEAQYCTTIMALIRGCSLLEGFKINGIMPICTQISDLAYQCYKLKNIEFPRQIGDSTHNTSGSTTIYQCYELETIILPNLVYCTASLGFNFDKKIKSITGNFESPTYEQYPYLPFAPNLQEFTCSNATVGYFWLGTSLAASKLTNIDIDWSGSSFSLTGYTPNVRIFAALDATELDRIMTLLPTVIDGQVLNISSNPGYATCNPSIATAKGWTVS